MRTRDVKTGQAVLTQTISGQWIQCTVIGPKEGEWLLRSPEHGYAIYRHARELVAEVAEVGNARLSRGGSR